jgi:hypothetical protein
MACICIEIQSQDFRAKPTQHGNHRPLEPPRTAFGAEHYFQSQVYQGTLAYQRRGARLNPLTVATGDM